MVQHEVAHEMNNATDSVWTENLLLLKRWMLFKGEKVRLNVLSLFSMHFSNISKGFTSKIKLCLNFLILIRKMYGKSIAKSFWVLFPLLLEKIWGMMQNIVSSLFHSLYELCWWQEDLPYLYCGMEVELRLW